VPPLTAPLRHPSTSHSRLLLFFFGGFPAAAWGLENEIGVLPPNGDGLRTDGFAMATIIFTIVIIKNSIFFLFWTLK
jgi:hypothetical protein